MKEQKDAARLRLFLDGYFLLLSLCHSCVCQEYRWYECSGEKNTLGVSVCFSQQPLCPLLLRHTLQGAAQLDVDISDCIVVRRAGVDTLKLAVFVLINVAKCGFGIGTLARELISVDYYTQSRSTYCIFAVLTLLGCTALLRFSIHLSLSADERQEKHLLPVEVVTYRGEKRML